MVACPVCRNTVFAKSLGSMTEIRGAFDVRRCERLGPDYEGQVDDALECGAMERAVEAALAELKN